MLKALQKLWHRHPARTVVAKHRINLTKPENMPLHQSPYYAELRHRDSGKMVANKMLAEERIELATTGRSLEIEFFAKEERISSIQ